MTKTKKAFSNAGSRWRDLITELRAAEIAHCDLQHGNVMVTPSGELKLVDYDCMCVPSLTGKRNLELGVTPYQHPQRDLHTKLSLSLDNFFFDFYFYCVEGIVQ